jgi:hypothetical protein
MLLPSSEKHLKTVTTPQHKNKKFLQSINEEAHRCHIKCVSLNEMIEVWEEDSHGQFQGTTPTFTRKANDGQ